MSSRGAEAMSGLGEGASRGSGVAIALVLVGAALSGCVGTLAGSSPSATEVASATPAYFDVEPSTLASDEEGSARLGPYVAALPAGEDSMLLKVPIPPEARVTVHQEWNDEDVELGFLVFDLLARNAEGAAADLREAFVLVAGFGSEGGMTGGTGWVPSKDVVSEVIGASTDPRFLAVFELPEKADHLVLTLSLRGEGVEEVQAAFGWVPEEASGGLSPSLARAYLSTLGASIGLPVLAAGSGANVAFAVDLGHGWSVSYGMEHSRSGTQVAPFLVAVDNVATSYAGRQADAGLQADSLYAYGGPGLVEWGWTYDGDGSAASVSGPMPNLGVAPFLAGNPAYMGYGMADAGRVEATFTYTTDAGFYGAYLYESHLRIPLPLDEHTDLPGFALACYAGASGNDMCGAASSRIASLKEHGPSWTAQELVEAALGVLRP